MKSKWITKIYFMQEFLKLNYNKMMVPEQLSNIARFLIKINYLMHNYSKLRIPVTKFIKI